MAKRALGWVLVVVLGALSLGCSPDCVTLCEELEAERCEGWDLVDCERDCSEADDIAVESGCEAELDAQLDCYADEEDICDADRRCDDESMDFAECAADFCLDHPNNVECRGLAAAGG